MRYGLMSTVAAAVLSLSFAAVAQGTSGSTGGSSGGTSSPQMRMQPQGSTGGSMQPGGAAQTPGTTGTQQPGGTAQTPGTTETPPRGTAQTPGTPGTQQPTTTGSINLSAENRTEVTRVFSSVRTEPVTNVNFNIAVGTVVPTTVTALHECPSEVERLITGLPDCRFIVVRDKIVLVEPSSRRIVLVLDRQG
jgi:hypothetical protein